MYKRIISVLILGLSVIFVSQSMAANNVPGVLSAPTNLSCALTDDSVCFYWDSVEGAVKYSVDIEVPTDADGDGLIDMIVELSFGTGDRTDGLPIDDPTLCVPLIELVYDYDINGDGIIDISEKDIPLTGTASAKVKALGPGKGKGRQNNAFSSPPCEFILDAAPVVLPY